MRQRPRHGDHRHPAVQRRLHKSAPVPPAATPSLADRATPGSPLGTSAANSPANAFPRGGRLNDLTTYTQWSWPDDGDAAAYYGYDLNVEFTETYVNALYTTFLTDAAPYDYSSSQLPPALHVRCVDRNQQHTLLTPIGTHVPSAYPQSAIVSAAARYPAAGHHCAAARRAECARRPRADRPRQRPGDRGRKR